MENVTVKNCAYAFNPTTCEFVYRYEVTYPYNGVLTGGALYVYEHSVACPGRVARKAARMLRNGATAEEAKAYVRAEKLRHLETKLYLY